MAYYYPEGYFGPICDAPVTDADIISRSRRAIDPVIDDRVDTFRYDDAFFGPVKGIYDPIFLIKAEKCKVDPVTGEFYDCEFEFVDDVERIDYDYLNRQIGLSDVFFVPDIGPDACSPFDADINIRPVAFYGSGGNQTLKYARERSTPVTYAATSINYWSTDGNSYGVWVNPEVCTLPNEQQQVTYFVDIPETDTYAFSFGCDDNGTVFLNEETTPIITATGGIFLGGAYNTPYVATRTLNQGRVKVVVNVTNSDAGFVDGNGDPEGLAYNWSRNPGGWFMKICRGTACQEPSTSDWVRAGPHQGWGTFMDTYAVYPSNTESLVGTHNETWNIIVPSAGDYILEYAADNTATFSLDGTQVASTSNFTSSDTVTLTSVSAGNHTISGSVTNNNENENSWSANPGGIAWTLKNSTTSAIVATSLDLLTQGGGNLIWHTRMAIEYEYYET